MSEPNPDNTDIQDIRKMLAMLAQKVDSIAGGEKPKVRPLNPGLGVREPVVEAPKPMDLKARIEIALTRESLDTARLAKTVDEPLEKVAAELKELRHAGKVYNVGYEDRPIWTWKVGDVGQKELIPVIKRLITERPMFLVDIQRATGASQRAASNAMIEIQRDEGENVIDMSAGGHACMYFLVTGRIRDASLPPKRPKLNRKKRTR